MKDFNAKNIRLQIQQITTVLMVTKGLCTDQNVSVIHRDNHLQKIEIPHLDPSYLSVNDSYQHIYTRMLEDGQYNLLLVDGSQLLYLFKFDKNGLKSSRLSYFPSLNLESYDDMPEDYQNDFLFKEIQDVKNCNFPIRFEFDRDVTSHARSHLTLGQHENCRVPIISPITPFEFTNFIIEHFYHSVHQLWLERWNQHPVKIQNMPDTIRDNEKAGIYLDKENSNCEVPS